MKCLFKKIKNNILNFFKAKENTNIKNVSDMLDNCLKTTVSISNNLNINNDLIDKLENNFKKQLDSKKELLLQLDKTFKEFKK